MERRNFFRLDMEKVFEFSIVDSETVEVISSPHMGTLKDLSAGGLSFTSDTDLEDGQMLEIKLSNEDKLFLLLGRVVREIKFENQRVYAVGFVHIDRHTQDKLVQLIFKLQSRQRITTGGGLHGYE